MRNEVSIPSTVSAGEDANCVDREAPPAAIDARSLIDEAVGNHRRRQFSAPPPHPVRPAGSGMSPLLLIFGVILPTVTLIVEAAMGLCRKDLFDPMPTLWHAALIAAVPIGNLVLLLHLSGTSLLRRGWVAVLNGFVAGVAGFYALLFLPLTPFAIVAIVVGIGILPLAPLTAFIVSLRIASRLRTVRGSTTWSPWPFAGGLAAALIAVVATDIPLAVTRIGIANAMAENESTRQRGIALLRTWGSTDLLLDLCYGRASRPAGPLSIMFAMYEQGLFNRPRPIATTDAAREIYYRVTGRPFNATAPTLAGQQVPAFGRVTFDRDLGGTTVGGLVPGLSLATSRIDGSIAAADAVAYVEWLFEVRNDGAAMSEARMTIALPPGAVVSRVTLWVNGVEEEAAFAGRGQVRAAYERVVRRSQDPFLVTTNGADRIFAQAFPVMPNGGVMKFRIGITAPLELENNGARGRFVLPAIVDRNFAVGEATRHAVWLESKRPLASDRAGLTVASPEAGLSRITGDLGDVGLAVARAVVTVARQPGARRSMAVNPETGTAVQEILPASEPPPDALMIVVDGSAGTGTHVKPILAALDALPLDLLVGLVIAGDRTTVIQPAPWSSDLKTRFAAALAAEPYVGGVDNTNALVEAMLALAGTPDARMLWLHGPQPVRFAGTRARFDQARERLRTLPALSLYALAPGPNMLLADSPWTSGARDIPATGVMTADLTRALRRLSGAEPVLVVRRTLVGQASQPQEPHMPAVVPETASGSRHLVRLAALEQVHALIRDGRPAAQKAAVELASLHRLVTPVSGAVVLETKQQYAAAGLVQGMQGEKGAVPTVPEPHEWMLLLLAAVGLGWLLRRRAHGAHGGMAGAH